MSKNKRLISLALAFVMTGGVFSQAVATTQDFQGRNHFLYENYNGTLITNTNVVSTNVVQTSSGDDKIIAEKIGEDNIAYKVSSNSGAIIQIGVAEKENKTWADLGYDASKPLIFKTKFYVSSVLLAELSTSKYIRLTPMLYNTDSNFNVPDTINNRYSLAKQNDKLIYGDNGYFAGRFVELSEDEWHEIVFVLDPETQSGGAQKIYIDGEDKTSALKISAFTATQFMQTQFSDSFYAGGVGISTPTGFSPENPFYIDDVEVYQLIKQTPALNINDNDTEIKLDHTFTADFGSEVNVKDFEGKIKITDSDNSEIIADVQQNGKKGISFTFEGMLQKTDYVLTIDEISTYEIWSDKTELTFTTQEPTDMTVSSSLENNAYVPSGDFSIELVFSDKVVADDLKVYTQFANEDDDDIEFDIDNINDYKVKILADGLIELTGYKISISSEFESVSGLPLRDDFELAFRTLEDEDIMEEDPYKPELQAPVIEVLKPEILNETWYLTADSGSVVQNENSVILTAGENTSFYPNATSSSPTVESNKGYYKKESTVTFNFDIKIPDKSAVSSASMNLGFYVTDESKEITGDKETGTYVPALVVKYEQGNGIIACKNTVNNNVTIVPDNQVTSGWITIKGFVNMDTGMATIICPDGKTADVDMTLLPNYATNKPYGWAEIMCFYRTYLTVVPSGDVPASIEIKDYAVKRLTNTLSIVNCSFNHNDCYVDTNNIILEFNEAVDKELLENSITVIDKDKKIVPDSVDEILEINDTSYKLKLKNLMPYSSYSLNISGLISKEFRAMGMDFSRNFVTKKGNDVFVDTLSSDAVLNTYGYRIDKASKISYNAVVKNTSATDASLKISVGLYTKAGELLDLKISDVFVESGNDASKLFVFDNDTPYGADDVRVFAWDNSGENVVLLHKPDSLKGSAKTENEFVASKELPAFNVSVYGAVNSTVVIGAKSNETGLYTLLVLDGENTPLTFDEDRIVYMGYAQNSNGEFSEIFKFTKPTGKYSAYVITEDNAYYSGFEFVNIDDLVDDFIKNVASGIISQNNLYEETVKFNGGLGIDFSQKFVSERDKTLFEKRIYEKRSSLTGPDNVSYVAQFMQNVKFAENEIKYLDELAGLSHYSLILNKLKEGKEFSKIDFLEFNKLSNAKKTFVTSSLVGKVFNDCDHLKREFVDKVAEAKKNSGDGLGSGGGSGSGGGAGSKPNAAVISTIMPVDGMTNTESSNTPPKALFDDMTGYEWAKDAVEYLARRGIISGVSKNKFAPDEKVTREQIVKMLVISADCFDKSAVSEFADCSDDAWFSPYVASAKLSGIVNGVSETEFGVGRFITRQDLAVMIYNVLKAKNYNLDAENKYAFSDSDQMSDYSKDAVAILAGAGIINGVGDNKFAPMQNATRAEAAKLISAVDKLLSYGG